MGIMQLLIVKIILKIEKTKSEHLKMAGIFLRYQFVFSSVFLLHSCSKQGYYKQTLWNSMPQDVLQEPLKTGDSEEMMPCVQVGEREVLWGARWEKGELFLKWAKKQNLKSSRIGKIFVSFSGRTGKAWQFIKKDKTFQRWGFQWHLCIKGRRNLAAKL